MTLRQSTGLLFAALAIVVLGPVTAAQTPRVRVGGVIKPPLRTKYVPPTYPEEAKAKGIQGTVFIDLLIGTDGTVTDAKVVRSAGELLDAAAVRAVVQWEYTPTLLNGEPAEVLLMVTLVFSLQV